MISCQFSLYPLGVDNLGPTIDAALAQMRGLGLDMDVGPMSTQVTGETAQVFEGLRSAFDTVARDGHVVMTVTVSNACPI